MTARQKMRSEQVKVKVEEEEDRRWRKVNTIRRRLRPLGVGSQMMGVSQNLLTHTRSPLASIIINYNRKNGKKGTEYHRTREKWNP